MNNGGLAIGIDGHNLQSLNAAPKIYPPLHDDYANDGSVPYVQTFCRSVCILLLQDYRNS